MTPNEPVPLSSMDVLRLLKGDRDVGREMRRAIARSLSMDVLAGLVPQRLRMDVAAHRWPVVIVGPDFDES